MYFMYIKLLFSIFTKMRFYIKHIFRFLKASAISILFGASWVVSFYYLDNYAVQQLSNYRSDFFLEIIVFFFSGLVGALLFLALIKLLEFINTLVFK